MELSVGTKRKFTFKDNNYEIKEILEKPDIVLLWTWNSGLCPHCKQKIEREVAHKFYRIEILVDETKKENDVTVDDIIILGDTIDRRKMILPKDKYNEVFSKTKNFKKFIGV